MTRKVIALATPSEPVISVPTNMINNYRKGRSASLIMVVLIVLQLNCSVVSAATLKTTSATTIPVTESKVVTITSTEVAPVISTTPTTVIDKDSTEEPEEDEPRTTIGRNHIYSSIRETVLGLPESCADYEVRMTVP